MSYEGPPLKEKDIIPKEEMMFDGNFYGPQTKHNWLFAESVHIISKEDLERLAEGDCLALNVDNEFVCFVMVKRDDI
jgi:hypothetical protein